MFRNNKQGTPRAMPDNTPIVRGPVEKDIRFRKLLEHSYEGITLLDKNLKVTFYSNSAGRINGWNTDNGVDYDMNALIHPADLDRVNLLLAKVLANPGMSATCDFRSRHFEGHYIWLECAFTNFFNDPEIDGIVCNFRDISAKKQAEDLLQQTNKELYAYKYALNESSIVAITDQKGIIRHVNDNFCRISKYNRAELIGQDHRIINSGYHDKAFIRNLWVTIAGGNIWKGELKNKAKDGSFYWVDTTIVPFLNQDGKPYQYAAIRSDITERKLSQEKIIESGQFIKTITDNLPAMIAYWDAGLRCLFANKPYWKWFNKGPDEILGINKRELLDENEFKLHELHITKVLQGSPQSFERTFHRADGTRIYTHTRYLPDEQNGIIKGFYSLIYDYTEVMLAEAEVKKKTEQIEDLLENITDGFIALDENLCYTYANKRITEMLGRNAASLMGKNMWDIFPDAVGSATYNAVTTALKEGRYVCNEDYYEPLDLWQENRVYPSGNGISMFIRDITKSKQEEYHLKLLESVITNTTDSVLITDAAPLTEPGPLIIYVNKAFTRMTGYEADEVLGRSPRLLQGPRSDKTELKRLSEALYAGQPYEITTINYKKNGDEFWVNFAVSPVTNEKGKLTHFIAVERDITERKNEELRKSLLAEISLIFNEAPALNGALYKVLDRLVEFGDFAIAEFWLVDTDRKKINLAAKFSRKKEMQGFFNESRSVKSFSKGEGLPGSTWQTGSVQIWNDLGQRKDFIRRDAAKTAGLKEAYGLPLFYNTETTGVLILGFSSERSQPELISTSWVSDFTGYLAAEIKRKQLEQELNQIFLFTPDILCIANTDGYFKKVNPAMSVFLEYNEQELLSIPFIELVHPDDKAKTLIELQNIIQGQPTYYIENRYISKSGKIKWFAWTTTGASEQGMLYCSAKDITEKKELEELLNKANNLARIGSWEIDTVRGTVYWSDITRDIHEVAPGFEPDLEQGINFYCEGESRENVKKGIEKAVGNGSAFDLESQILTAKGNIKWIRVIGEAEFEDNRCVRLYGSFQDIDQRKRAEIAGKSALEERNIILESIDDAFFAVDKNWVVTYWNNMAEKVLGKPKSQVLNQNLWAIYTDAINSESYNNYHLAIKTNQAVHFEDYYPPLGRWYEVSAYPSDTGLSVYIKDITDRKESDIRLRDLNEMLKKHTKQLAISNAELEQFAYVASHDLQEPLRMVTSFLTQLERKYGQAIDDRGKQYIHFAVDGAKRMRQIILDLLDFSRIGRTEDDLEKVDINKLINEILVLYRRQMEELNATITFGELPQLYTYKTPLRQVFQNLIANSLKYHQANVAPLIHISCKENETLYLFSVQDNGIGIEKEYFEKIFIIFQRLHNKDEYSGTGMGLAISKKIVENLGGKIWVRSAIGEGSTFYFTILKTDK